MVLTKHLASYLFLEAGPKEESETFQTFDYKLLKRGVHWHHEQ
uniref:Uncharacterized protein n=1 Tax=Anguilla anguilla TaxID=7936 RepID=A0A0E9RL00_ANGAN